jgi:hypothetical protein
MAVEVAEGQRAGLVACLSTGGISSTAQISGVSTASGD